MLVEPVARRHLLVLDERVVRLLQAVELALVLALHVLAPVVGVEQVAVKQQQAREVLGKKGRIDF